MPIIFNMYALLQALIAIIILGIIQLLISLFGLDYNMISGSKEIFITLQILAIITAYLDLKGIKGSLFYLPTWLTLIIGSIIVFKINYNYETFQKNQYFLYLSSLLIIIFYIKYEKKELQKKWKERIQILELLKSQKNYDGLSEIEYWKMASHLFYNPSFLFLYFNPLWSKIYTNTFTGDEFLIFYKEFVNTIDIESIQNKRSKRWTIEIKESFNKANNFNEYEHFPFCFARLADTINIMNAKVS